MNSLLYTAGLNRVIAPLGSNPFDAQSLRPGGELKDDEIRLKVTSINLDSTSYLQLVEKFQDNELLILNEVKRIVSERGKMHNSSTNSGGVLCGVVSELGSSRQAEVPLGSRVATLVSNTLVPLILETATKMVRTRHQIQVTGEAILPPFARYAQLPEDIAEPIALSIFDVCGVVPHVERLCAANSTVVILGGAGKAGLLATYTAAQRVSPRGKVIAVLLSSEQLEAYRIIPSNLPIQPLVCDSRETVRLEKMIKEITDSRYADVVIDCTNALGVEISASSCCREGGVVCYFNMATRFQAATLGAELIGRDIQYQLGYGLLPGAAGKALSLVRLYPQLLNLMAT